eukprot:UN09481
MTFIDFYSCVLNHVCCFSCYCVIFSLFEKFICVFNPLSKNLLFCSIIIIKSSI